MDVAWGTLWDKSHNRLKVGWLITAAVVAIYIGTNSGRDYAPGVAAERGAGVADSPEWDSASLWHQTGATQFVRGIVGGRLARLLVCRPYGTLAYFPSFSAGLRPGGY